jgi:hypothetical protein
MIIFELSVDFLDVESDIVSTIATIFFRSACRSTVLGVNFLYIKRVHDPLHGIQNNNKMIKFLGSKSAKKSSPTLEVPRKEKASKSVRLEESPKKRTDLIIKHFGSLKLSENR